MEDTCTCHRCEMENAYFNGTSYRCPDCDYQWTDNSIPGSEHGDNNFTYESLIKLQKPFFQLNHGKLYNCKVEHKKGIEEISVIPLTFEKAKTGCSS